MKKTIQEITNNLQDIAHSGFAQSNIYVKVLDAVYKIDDVKPYNEPDGKVFFVINTKPLSEKNEAVNE